MFVASADHRRRILCTHHSIISWCRAPPVAGEDLRLPIEQCVIAIFADQHLGEQCWRCQAAGDHPLELVPVPLSRRSGRRISGEWCASRAAAPEPSPAFRSRFLRLHAARCHSRRRSCHRYRAAHPRAADDQATACVATALRVRPSRSSVGLP